MPSSRSRRAALLILAAVTLACGKGSDPTPAVDAGPPGPHPYWFADASAANNPFPDLRALDGGMHVRDHFWTDFMPPAALSKTLTTFEQGYAPSFAESLGYGTSGPTLVAFSDRLNPTSLAGHVRFAVHGANGWTAGPDALVTYEEIDGGAPFFVSARPSVPLPNETDAELVLTRGITTDDGTALVASPDFAASSSPERADVATALGVQASDFLLALPIRTPDATHDMLSLASWAAQPATTPYTLHTADGGNDATQPLGVWTGSGIEQWSAYLDNSDARATRGDGGHADIGTIVMGTFPSHDLRDITYDDSGIIASSAFKPAWLAAPDTAPTADLRFLAILPKTRQPNGKYRMVIAGHGLLGRNTFNVTSSPVDPTSFCAGLAEMLAQQGLGCIGIDAVHHGSRGTPDGQADLVGFFNLTDLRSTRDNFRQTEVDLLQLSRLVGQLDVDGDGVPDLDADDLGYFGVSLGGIMGSVFVPIDSRVKYGVLNVPTGGLAMMWDAPYIHDNLGLLVDLHTLIDPNVEPLFDQSLPLIAAEGQMIVEPADPFSYGYLVPQKRVLAQEGIGDQTLPNANTDELFLAQGLPEITADRSDDGGVSGYQRFKPSDYGVTDPNFNPHGTFYAVPQARHQAMTFLASHGTQLSHETP